MAAIIIYLIVTTSLSESSQNLQDNLKENKTQKNENNATCGDKYCYTIPEFQFECTWWNCSICNWGNDSCQNFDIGMRADCPTRICKDNPIPPSPPTPTHDKYFLPVLIFCLILIFLLVIYLTQLIIRDRRRRRAMERRIDAHRRLFMEAPSRLEEARSSNEEAQQIIRELAAAANIPIPQFHPPASPPRNPDSILEHVEQESEPTPSQAPPSSQGEPVQEQRTRRNARTRIRNFSQEMRNRLPPLRANMQNRFTLFRQRLAENPRFARLRNEPENA